MKPFVAISIVLAAVLVAGYVLSPRPQEPIQEPEIVEPTPEVKPEPEPIVKPAPPVAPDEPIVTPDVPAEPPKEAPPKAAANCSGGNCQPQRSYQSPRRRGLFQRIFNR